MKISQFPKTGGAELYITTCPLPDEGYNDMMERVGAVLQEHDATVVRQEVWGAGSHVSSQWPVLAVGNCSLAGTHVTAVTGADVKTIVVNGRNVGRMIEKDSSRHVWLSGVLPNDPKASPEEQTRQVLGNLEAALRQAGMSYTDVVRTWFFNDDILSWYGVFNKVRTAFYQERGVLDGLLPASTGIGAPNPAGAALTAGAWAVQGAKARTLPSPMQGPAPSYGSSFSRAVEVISGGLRRITVSGTASIAPEGHTVHVGDVSGQIDLTMKVVRAILQEQGLGWHHVTRATAYLRHAHDAPFFEAWRVQNGLSQWPVVVTPAVVCRDDLLFEVELDAVAVV